MYCEHFSLLEKPFSLSPDPRYLFLSESHGEALAHLIYGIEQGEGFIAITGEVGTGKTTLCRALIQRLGEGTEVAFLWNPVLSGTDLMHAIHTEFGLNTDGRTFGQLNEQLNRFLLEKNREERHVLLVIDEAQNLSKRTLEQIRLLSNLETDRSKLLQIVLLGQPELEASLASEDLRQLRQRIGVWWRLAPLGREETAEYVAHRLRVASNGRAVDLFTSRALREVYRTSRGIPRLVNGICDRALLATYADAKFRVDAETVRRSAAERDAIAARAKRPASFPVRPLSYLVLGIALGVATLFGWSHLRSGELGGELELGRGWMLTQQEKMESTPVAVPIQPPVARSSSDDVDVAAASPPSLAVPLEPATAAAPLLAADLGSHLVNLSPGISYASALRSLLGRWGEPLPAETALSISTLLSVLEDRGFSILWLEGSDLSLLQGLDHPPILLFPSVDGVQRTAYLKGLDEGGVVLLEIGGQEPIQIEPTELRKIWGGDAFIAWRDFDALPEVLQAGNGVEEVSWVQTRLLELGIYQGEVSGAWDQPTQDAVLAFQRNRGLRPDAAVGPRTKMALYAALTGYPVPRLSAEEVP